MRPLLTLLSIVLLGAGVCACGGTGKTARKASSSVVGGSAHKTTAASAVAEQDYTKVDHDKDNDIQAPADDTNNNGVLDLGRPAGAADNRAVTALIRRYYAAALKGDGPAACSMLYFSFAESVAEDYGSTFGPPYLRHSNTCAAVMVKLFKHFHNRLVAEVPLLKARVRLERHRGIVVLSFGKLPEREIPVLREGSAWKVVAILDSELP